MLFDLLFRLRSLWRRRERDSELTDEVEFHLARETEKLVKSGMPAHEAARHARLEFGFPELTKDDCREARGTRWIEDSAHDVNFGMRTLRLNPGFAAVAIVSLALGIGANTAIFHLLNAVRLRSLPVERPAELYSIQIAGEGASGNFTSRYGHLSSAQWEQIKDRQRAFFEIAAWNPRRFNLAEGGEMRPAEGMLVSGAFFAMLGVNPLHGRVLEPRDDSPGCGAPPAVVSYAFWRRELGSDAAAIGRQLRVDGHTVTIVGVTMERFFGVEVGRSFDIALPLCAEGILAAADSQLTSRRHNYWLAVIGRLREGWTAQQANAHLQVISPDVFAASVPDDATSAEALKRYRSLSLIASPSGKGLSSLRADYEKPLWLLLGSAGLVLLIACGNLANLLLARANVRRREIATRLALGASKGRLVRQLLTESFLLATGGALLGLVVAQVAGPALVSLLVTADNPVALDTRLDWQVLVFSFLAASVTCVLFGLAPAVSAVELAPSSSRNVAGSRERSAFRKMLAAVQVALCVVLVGGAMLFGRSAYNLLNGDLGFEPEQVLVTSIDTRRLRLSEERQKQLYREILEKLRATPGVSSAAQSNIVPMSGWESNTSFTLAGRQSADSRISMVSSEYFRTLGTPLLAGRDFDSTDASAVETSVIVNEAFAAKYLGGIHPIGAAFRSPYNGNRLCRVIGVVPNTKYRTLREPLAPIVFFSTSQVTYAFNFARYLVRSDLPARELTGAVRNSIALVSPEIDVEFVSLGTQIEQSVVRERMLAAVAGGFGCLAALIAATGLYGLLSYFVASRRREIGIRIAMGATSKEVSGLVVREAGSVLATGAIGGLLATVVAAQAAASLLYELEPADPATLAGAVIVLIGIGIVGAYVPARRAAMVDPGTVLRLE